MASVSTVYLGRGDGALPGSLDLTDGATWRVLRGGLTIRPNGDGTAALTLPVRVRGATADAYLDQVATLNALLAEAARAVMTGNQGWVTLSVRFGAAGAFSYFDVLAGQCDLPDTFPPGNIARGTLTLTCLDAARSDPYATTATGALSNGAILFVVAGVPGDAEALVRARVTTTAARARLSRRARAGATTGDWSPWADLTTTPTGASNVADAAALGGAFKRRSIASASWSDIASATLPAGALDTGRASVLARLRDGGGQPVGAPTGLAGTVAESTLPATAAVPSGTIVQTRTGGSTGNGASGAATLSALPATVVGNVLIAAVTATGANAYAIAAPSGWVLVKDLRSPAADGEWWLFARENSASITGTVTWTITRTSGTAAWSADVIFHEVATTLAGGVINALAAQTYSAADVALTIDPTNAGDLILGFAWTPGATPALYLGAETEVATRGGRLASFARMATDDASAALTLVYASTPVAAIAGAVALGLRATPAAAAGSLAPGAYTARVQAVDISGALSNASAGTVVTVAAAGASIAYAWGAPAVGVVAGYVLTVQAPDGSFRAFAFDAATTSYAMTDVALGATAGGLPAVSGATASPGRFRALLNGAPIGDEVTLPAAGSWRLVDVGAGLLGATARALDGSRGGGTLTIQGASGGGGAANLDADAVFLPALDEPTAAIETTDLAASTGLLVLESDRALRRSIGWEAPSGGPATTVTSAALTAGLLTLAPGDNLVAVALDGAAGVSDLSLTANVTLTIWPRARYGRGT